MIGTEVFNKLPDLSHERTFKVGNNDYGNMPAQRDR